jgi:spore coat polysaccharide biosynthesis protein SpsF (cytidylyltransferase family)
LLVSNKLELSFPDGLDVEIISLKALLRSQKICTTKLNKEHVTTFIIQSKIFTKCNFKNSINYSDRRWTLDYFEDYVFLKKVVKYFSPNIYFSWKDLIKAEKNSRFLVNKKKRQHE